MFNNNKNKMSGMSVLLNRTKCAKLNHCTPLDRVLCSMFVLLLKRLPPWRTV